MATAPVTGASSGEGDESTAAAEMTIEPPAAADAETDEPMEEDVKADDISAADPAATSSEVEDKAVETALVETAEEVAAVAKEVEAELTLVEKDDSVLALTGDGAAAATDVVPSVTASDEPPAKTPNLKETLSEADSAADDAEPMEGVKEETTASEVAAAPIPVPVEDEALPAAVPTAAAPVEADEGKYTLVLSGHRYSPTNFWYVPCSLLGPAGGRLQLTELLIVYSQ